MILKRGLRNPKGDFFHWTDGFWSCLCPIIPSVKQADWGNAGFRDTVSSLFLLKCHVMPYGEVAGCGVTQFDFLAI
jgi:hypothetical protein